ncbi:hypothetical protein ABZP36_019630 [Zizania latifolia]
MAGTIFAKAQCSPPDFRSSFAPAAAHLPAGHASPTCCALPHRSPCLAKTRRGQEGANSVIVLATLFPPQLAISGEILYDNTLNRHGRPPFTVCQWPGDRRLPQYSVYDADRRYIASHVETKCGKGDRRAAQEKGRNRSPVCSRRASVHSAGGQVTAEKECRKETGVQFGRKGETGVRCAVL